jgi:hypothetical protein
MPSSSNPRPNQARVSLRGQPSNILLSSRPTIDQPSAPCDGVCAKVMDNWVPLYGTAFTLLPLNPINSDTSRPFRADVPTVSDYFTISHERLGDVGEILESNADRVQQLPYEICCVCEVCQQHRQSMKDRDRGIDTPRMVTPGRPPSMAPVFRHLNRPTTLCTCHCYWCTSHVEAINQLAEKVVLGASEEAVHSPGVSWIDIAVSDWQDILGKKRQAYWSFKALGEIAGRPSIHPPSLKAVCPRFDHS